MPPFDPKSQAVPAITAVSPSPLIAPKDAQSSTPSPLADVTARREKPTVPEQGVLLAKLVLYIAAGSIVLLLGYLVSMDLVIGKEMQSTYSHILNPSRIGSEFYTLGRLEKLIIDLKNAKDISATLSHESMENAENILKMVDALPSVTTTQKDELQACVPLPKAGYLRVQQLERCVSTLESIRQAALEAAAGATNSQSASDSATKINEHRQSLHTFWIQAAQLILLNLLLPLLTALLGYIFGTQQAQRTDS